MDHMTDEELRQAHNAAPQRPNEYGQELLRRIHERDRAAFGMGAEYLTSYSPAEKL